MAGQDRISIPFISRRCCLGRHNQDSEFASIIGVLHYQCLVFHPCSLHNRLQELPQQGMFFLLHRVLRCLLLLLLSPSHRFLFLFLSALLLQLLHLLLLLRLSPSAPSSAPVQRAFMRITSVQEMCRYLQLLWVCGTNDRTHNSLNQGVPCGYSNLHTTSLHRLVLILRRSDSLSLSPLRPLPPSPMLLLPLLQLPLSSPHHATS